MLDKRLKKVLSMLDEDCSVLYDIGSDHAYLPIEAIKQKIIKKAYAVDNKESPLKSAITNIEAHGLNTTIEPILSDGIADLREDVDCITICGMGGKTIHDILSGATLKNIHTLILQPNNHPQLVRKLVESIPFMIVDETVVAQREEVYPVIKMRPGKQTLDQKDLHIGPILRKHPSRAYKESLEQEYVFLQSLIERIPDDKAKQPLIKKRDLLEEVFNEWRDNQTVFR